MATLTPDERSKTRRFISKFASQNGFSIDWTKAIMNAAAQSVETRIENSASVISNDMDIATSPFVLDNALKKQIVAYVLQLKARRDS